MPLEPQVVDATLQVEQPDTSLAPLAVGTDAGSPTGVALPVLDDGARTRLDGVLVALGSVVSALTDVAGNTAASGTEATTQAILAAVDGIEALLGTIGTLLATPTDLSAATIAALDNGLTDTQLRAAPVVVDTGLTVPTDGLTDAELRATPVPVSATDLDIRNLDDTTDAVRSVDAAETSGFTYAPVNFSTSGAHTIVTVPPGQRLRLRRFLVTGASVPDPLGDPILTLDLGTVTLRTQILSGRFDILGDDGEDLVITSSKAGQVDGTVAYTLENA